MFWQLVTGMRVTLGLGGGGGGEYGGYGLVSQPTEEFKSPMAPPKPLLTDMMKNPSKVVMLKVLQIIIVMIIDVF